MQEINYQSKLFFKNEFPDLSKLPPENSSAYRDLVFNEIDKCVNGVNVNGLIIPPTLYYFLNHCHIDYDIFDGKEQKTIISLPYLKDNDWLLHTNYYECKKEMLGFIVGGSRQCSKSTFLVCITTHELFFNKNAEVVALFSAKPDKQTFTKKLKIAVENNTSFLTIPPITNDYEKELMRFGYKDITNKDIEYSKIYMYLTLEGLNTEVAAGKTISLFLIDECGKAPFLRVNEAVLPAIRSQLPGFEKKLKGTPLYSFTGGNNDKVKDIKTMFYSPESYYCKAFDEDKTGLFIPGTYRSNFKKETTFAEFLKNKGIENKHPEILTEKFLVTDYELANRTLDQEEEDAKKESQSAFISRRTYYARKKEHIFNSGKGNIFSSHSDELEKLYHYLTHECEYPKVEFDYNNKPVYSSKPILTEILKNPEDYQLDCASVLLTDPLKSYIPLYCAGMDPINVNKTSTSASLCSWYIMQKDTTDINNKFNSRIVAWYNGRKDIKHMRVQILKTLEFFGADRGLISLWHEAADDTLTQYFDEQNKGRYLADTYNLAKEINPNSNVHNTKGWRPIKRHQEFYLQAILDYMEEEMEDGRLGLWRIPDPYLVQQILNFEGDLGPMDAIVGFGHCLININKDKKYGQVKTADVEEKVIQMQKKPKSIFGYRKTNRKSII